MFHSHFTEQAGQVEKTQQFNLDQINFEKVNTLPSKLIRNWFDFILFNLMQEGGENSPGLSKLITETITLEAIRFKNSPRGLNPEAKAHI